MAENENVSREVAIDALRAGKVEVWIESDGLVTLVCNEHDMLETLVFTPTLDRKFVFRLSVLYHVPIHWFWNPSMIPNYKVKAARVN